MTRGATVTAIFIVLLSASRVRPAASQAAALHTPATPVANNQSLQEMEAAGVKLSFDVASVKINNSGPNQARSSNVISFNPGASSRPTGGLFTTTNEPLPVILAWAFDLSGNQQLRVFAAMPKWAMVERLDIEAKAAGDPDEAQMQLMAQSLLEGRFKLAVHTESKQGPVYALEMVTPGKLGPQLKPHAEDPSCAGGNSALCAGGLIRMPPSAPGLIRYEGRNVTLSVIAKYLPLTANTGTGLDRPVIDRTGLGGVFDFSIEFAPQMGATTETNSGPILIEALKDQLGLKLEPATGPVETIVIDHIEEPTPN